jgi:hypothetical protein
MSTFNSQSYFKVNQNLGSEYYFRTAANGDIMKYSESQGQEYLYVPASPTVNQEWNYPFNFQSTRKVISVNATYTSSKCTYTGLLQIREYDSAGSGGSTYWYKKGLGMVRTDQIWSGQIYCDLIEVTLN